MKIPSELAAQRFIDKDKVINLHLDLMTEAQKRAFLRRIIHHALDRYVLLMKGNMITYPNGTPIIQTEPSEQDEEAVK